MQRSTEKLYKIFKLESEFGYTNKAVVGGLEKLTDTWVGEARADGISEEKIQKVTALLHQYSDLAIKQRVYALQNIGQILEVPGIKHLAAPPEEKQLDTEPAVKNINTEQNHSTPKGRGTTRSQASAAAPIPATAAHEDLNAPTTIVRGIGPKQSVLLEKLNLYTIEDMIYYFPRRYDDYSELRLIKDLKFGEEVTILAYIKSISSFTSRNKNRKIIQAVVSDDTGNIQLLWFNQDYQLRYLRKNMFLSISGKIEQYMGRLVMYHPEYEQVEQEQLNTKRIVPVYSLTARLNQRWLRRMMYQIVNQWAPKIPEFMTEYIIEDADLMDLSTALKEIQFP
jgi:ATP-dependent DNA helicase RecG